MAGYLVLTLGERLIKDIVAASQEKEYFQIVQL